MPELSTLNVRNLLMGKICIEAQDVNCAQNSFAAVYNKDRGSALAAYGLAWVSLRNKQRSTAYDYVRVGLQNEPNYLPLLEMRDQLESE
jgi:hypothetical protein